MMPVLAVATGGAIGASCRYLFGVGVGRIWPSAFPLATLIINILGSLAMGLLVGLFATRWAAPQTARLFLTTGILGGFTTFSSFSLDTAVLVERGAGAQALLYVAVSVAGAILALFAGLWLVRAGS